MEKLLQKLLEAEILSEDTKSELESAYKQHLDEAVESAKEEAAADVRAQLTEQWVQERDALIEAVDNQVTDMVNAEFEELKEDIERFRDLEAEYAEKLVEAKASMAEELKGDLATLVEQLDKFLEIRLSAELEEFAQDIAEIKKNEVGRRVIEAIIDEVRDNFIDEESVVGSLREAEQRLEDTLAQLEETNARVAELERERKLDELLAPLSGAQRDVMETILSNVATEHLEEGYKTFIGRVLKETSEEDVSEKEDSVLAESASEDGEEDNLTVVSGNDEDLLSENEQTGAETVRRMSEEQKAALRRLAGIR